MLKPPEQAATLYRLKANTASVLEILQYTGALFVVLGLQCGVEAYLNAPDPVVKLSCVIVRSQTMDQWENAIMEQWLPRALEYMWTPTAVTPRGNVILLS